jgi:hypothetical protein
MAGATVVEGTVVAAAEVGEVKEAGVQGVQVRAAARVVLVVRAALARVMVGRVAAAAKEAVG